MTSSIKLIKKLLLSEISVSYYTENVIFSK